MAVPSPSMIDKSSIRAAMRAARAALDPRPVIGAPDAFTALLSRGMIVASYMPVRGEADPAALVRAAAAAGCRLALPHVIDRATPLRFLSWCEEAALATGPFGLLQPADSHEVAPDIILTPLVAFDRRGNRLGQGAGHYDRAFARYPAARRIGVAFAMQEAAALPADPWDEPLEFIVTEREWITP